MHNLKAYFDKIMVIVKDSLKQFTDKSGNPPKRGRKPKFSDIVVITFAITAEALSITSENLLFKNQKTQRQITRELTIGEDTYIIDSMPVPICRFARAKRLSICKESIETAPNFGYCAAQRAHYFGFKLHGVCSFNGVFTSYDLSKTNVHDIHYFQDVKYDYPNCLFLADKAYLGASRQLDLFENYQIRLNTPLRYNQIDYHPQPKIYRKARKRIETLFSQLYDQFHIDRNYAKSFRGLAARILSKITALTVLQFINKLNNGPLNHIKYALA